MSGQVTFTPGETVARVTVPLVDDVLDEYNELFRLRLGGAVGGTITDGTAVGTIVDNDPEPTIEVLPAEAIEGEPLDFEVRLDAISGRTVTANFATDDSTGGATAIEGEDYARAAGTVTIRSGARSVTVSVLSLDDQLPEESETFVFRLSHTTNAVIGGGTTLGTIHDNDLLPNLSVGDLYVVEGDDPAAVFVVELDRPAIADVTFDYATVTGSARPGADCDDPTDDTDDYLPVTGNATILAGETQTTISVTICDDTVVEEDEDFILRLTNPVGALIVDEVGATATILDNDGAPRVIIGDAAAFEADGAITFPVTLSHHSATDVLLDYATFDGTATQPDDYIATADRLRIPAGDTEATITVLLTDDVFVEDPPVETFTLRLTAANADDAEIIDGEAIGTIYDDDEPPFPTVADVQALENQGTVTVRVDLSHPSDQEIDVLFRTLDYHETFDPDSDGAPTESPFAAGTDYVATSGTLVFGPGAVTQTFAVTLIDDTHLGVNPDTQQSQGFFVIVLETYDPMLCNSSQLEASLHNCALVVVYDDESLPEISPYPDHRYFVLESVGSVTLSVGHAGFPLNESVTVAYRARRVPSYQDAYLQRTGRDVATANSDFAAVQGAVTIAAGSRSGTFSVPILQDTDQEPNEVFWVELTRVTSTTSGGLLNATIGNTLASVEIIDDDTLPEVSVSDAEADEQAGVLTFRVELSRISADEVVIEYTTVDGTATAGDDYTGVTSGSVTIPAGDLFATIEVDVVNDGVVEGEETFTLQLTGVFGATLLNTEAQGTILDADDLPSLSVEDVSRVEDDASQYLNARVTLSRPSGQTVWLSHAVAEVPSLGEYAATYRLDFEEGFDVPPISIPAGATSRTFTVRIFDDDVPERDERFLILISDPVGATIRDGSAWATIVNNDLPIVSIENVEVSESDPSAIFTVALHEPSLDPTSVRYRTQDWPYGGTSQATPGEDFTDVDDILTFAAGETTATITVPIRDDTVDEYDEAFVMQLYDPVGVAFANESALATIADDEPGWWIGDAAGSEDSGTVSFLVRRDPPADAAFTLQYEVADGGATGGDDCADPGVDYLTPLGSVDFAPGATEATIAVTVCDDATVEGNETFLVSLLDVTGRRTTATGTIAFSD